MQRAATQQEEAYLLEEDARQAQELYDMSTWAPIQSPIAANGPRHTLDTLEAEVHCIFLFLNLVYHLLSIIIIKYCFDRRNLIGKQSFGGGMTPKLRYVQNNVHYYSTCNSFVLPAP